MPVPYDNGITIGHHSGVWPQYNTIILKLIVMNDRKSVRLREYDYSIPGYYFVTMCVKGRIHAFGKITNGEMIKNPNGEIAYDNWMKIPGHFKNVQLDAFVVMPNHVHGIIIIDDMIADNREMAGNINRGNLPVGNRHACSL